MIVFVVLNYYLDCSNGNVVVVNKVSEKKIYNSPKVLKCYFIKVQSLYAKCNINMNMPNKLICNCYMLLYFNFEYLQCV